MEAFSREELANSTGGSIYKLVILAARRAIEIAEGAPKLVDADASIKPGTVTLREIVSGKIRGKESK